MTRLRYQQIRHLLPEGQQQGAPSKYSNIRTEVDGLKFDSRREARRWLELVRLQAAGAISDLRRQVRYPLRIGTFTVETYVADFAYSEDGQTVVEDSKGGVLTREYLRKRRWMKAIYHIAIRET